MSQPPPRSRREGNRRVNVASTGLWLAPLRGVTIRAFRTVFADAMREAGFSGAFSPFIPANPGFRRSRKIFDEILPEGQPAGQILVPQAIGKDPWALREWCKAVKDLGYGRADLNAGCPFPMIRKKGRGSGLMRTPDVLDRMLDAGCAEMGPGNFSLKTRLGVESPVQLLCGKAGEHGKNRSKHQCEQPTQHGLFRPPQIICQIESPRESHPGQNAVKHDQPYFLYAGRNHSKGDDPIPEEGVR